MNAEEELRNSLIKTLFNLENISKARCFSGKNVRFSFTVGDSVPLADLVAFVEHQSADLAQQIVRV